MKIENCLRAQMPCKEKKQNKTLTRHCCILKYTIIIRRANVFQIKYFHGEKKSFMNVFFLQKFKRKNFNITIR